jgi:hypothetical protein
MRETLAPLFITFAVLKVVLAALEVEILDYHLTNDQKSQDACCIFVVC